MLKFEVEYFTVVNSSPNRDQALTAALCERVYCVRVCVYIYIHPLNETLLILKSPLRTRTKIEERKYYFLSSRWGIEFHVLIVIV